MPANSGMGQGLPLPAQTNAGDIFILQTPTGNKIYIHNGLGWVAMSTMTLTLLDVPDSNVLAMSGGSIWTPFTPVGVPASASAVLLFVSLPQNQGFAYFIGGYDGTLFWAVLSQKLSQVSPPYTFMGQFVIVPAHLGQIAYQADGAANLTYSTIGWFS